MLNHSEMTLMFLALTLLLGLARVLGEAARRLNQPAVIGEILAGIILGPTVLGRVAPAFQESLFPSYGHLATVFNAATAVCAVLFLMVAGLEVDLSTVFRLRGAAVTIGFLGLILPFGAGFGLGQLAPNALGMELGANQTVFSLFLGIAMSISALPVIAKTLMDLNLFKTDLGMIVIAVAVFHDLCGWIVFAMVLGLMNSGSEAVHVRDIAFTILGVLAFAGAWLTVGRWAIHRILPWLQAHTIWPGGVVSFCIVVALAGGTFTEWIGIHAIFGAFIVGVAIGDSDRLQAKTRNIIEQFIGSVFAPFFFASIGLKVDFVANFDLPLVLLILFVACVGMTTGSVIGARLTGLPRRQSWAIGLALNARGAMEIVLALLALQQGVIGNRLFVALVVMALVTSMIAGPLMQVVLRRKKIVSLRKLLDSKQIAPSLAATTSREAIAELAAVLAPRIGVDASVISSAAWERERSMSTALSNGVAIPHARIPDLARPAIAVGVSRSGVDFDSSDGLPTRLILLVVTPLAGSSVQLEILGAIARLFQDKENVEALVRCSDSTQLLGAVNMLENEHAPK